jgi:hypothetical protein
MVQPARAAMRLPLLKVHMRGSGGDEFQHCSPGIYPRSLPPKPRYIYVRTCISTASGEDAEL